MANLWAQLDQQNQNQAAPPPPSVFAAPEMTGPAPDMGAPAAPQIARIPTTGENQIQDTQNQLNKVHWQQANPWGTAENHPGKLGKIAHVFSNIGNIAGDIFAPDVMAHIPGTQMNREVKENELTKRLDQENTENEQNLQREAMTAHENELTAEEPGKAEESRKLTESTIGKNDQDKAVSLQQAHANAVQKVIAAGGDPSKDPVVQNYEDAIQRIQKQPAGSTKPDSPEQQYIDEYQKTHPGGSIADAERAYTLDTQRPPQIMPIMGFTPNQGGGYTATAVRPGQTVDQGFQTAAGVNAGNVADVKEQKGEVKSAKQAADDYRLMQTLATHPSPTNDLAMVMHYIGATKPDALGKLRLNQNEISLVMGTRSSFGDLQALGEKIQSGQKLTPDQRQDMLATMKILADSHGGGSETEPQRPANVPEGYKFNGSGPKGAGWYAPTAK